MSPSVRTFSGQERGEGQRHSRSAQPRALVHSYPWCHMKTQWPAQPTPDTTVWRPVRVMSGEITAGDAFIQTTWWLGTVQRTGEALEHFQKKEQEGRKEERSERRRRRQPPSRGGALRQAVQNHPRESQFRCRWMTGTIAGRVGYRDAEKFTPFLTLKWQFCFDRALK